MPLPVLFNQDERQVGTIDRFWVTDRIVTFHYCG